MQFEQCRDCGLWDDDCLDSDQQGEICDKCHEELTKRAGGGVMEIDEAIEILSTGTKYTEMEWQVL